MIFADLSVTSVSMKHLLEPAALDIDYRSLQDIRKSVVESIVPAAEVNRSQYFEAREFSRIGRYFYSIRRALERSARHSANRVFDWILT
jgi:hypothetical protein